MPECYSSKLPSELLAQILQQVLELPGTNLLQCALTCKAWSHLALQLLWQRPIILKPQAWLRFSKTLALPTQYTPYAPLVRRINLSAIPEFISDDSLITLSDCKHLDRLTLAGCTHLTNHGLMDFLNMDVGRFLLSIDLSEITHVTDDVIFTIAENCKYIQGLNLSVTPVKEEEFNTVTDKSIIALAENCLDLKKVKTKQKTTKCLTGLHEL
jgi:F-box and leucine-rich repeat protein GRR1